MGRKKIVVEIDEEYVDQKKHQMVTYIIGKAYNNKKCRTLIAQKKIVFARSKKKVFKQQKLQPPSPPLRYQMVRP